MVVITSVSRPTLGRAIINNFDVVHQQSQVRQSIGLVFQDPSLDDRLSALQNLRFHDLRHSHATLLLKVGIHPKIVSERLGHANIGITLDTYSHVLPGLQEKAAERFDEMLGSRVIAEDVSKGPLAI